MNAIFEQLGRRKSLFSVAQALLAKGCSCETCIGFGICGARAFGENESALGEDMPFGRNRLFLFRAPHLQSFMRKT